MGWEHYPGLCKWAQHNHQGAFKRQAGYKNKKVRNDNRLERQRKGPQAEDCRSPLEAEEDRETDFPLELPEGMQL